jgi:hypothetical protein
MASSPSQLTPQEVDDLLHKFITESTNMQAMFFSPVSGVRVFLRGFVKLRSDGSLQVAKDTESTSPRILCDLGRYSSALYGDERAFKGTVPENFFKTGLSSALGFVFRDGSILVLFEPTV